MTLLPSWSRSRVLGIARVRNHQQSADIADDDFYSRGRFLGKTEFRDLGFLYGSYFLIFERPRPWNRIFIFGAASSFAVIVSILVGYVLWRDDFIYWAFTVLGAHGVSPLRSFRNLMIVWPYFVIGLIGGGVLMRNKEGQRLIGPWFIWLGIISIETYTSGIAWMTNHIGPGSLIAGAFCRRSRRILVKGIRLYAPVSSCLSVEFCGCLRSVAMSGIQRIRARPNTGSAVF